MPNMVHLAVGDLLIAVHRADPPTEEEWSAYTETVRQIDKERLRTLIFTDGGAPTGQQRERLEAALQGKPALTAVISSSSMVRGVVNAINALPALTVCEHTVCAEGRPFTWNGVTAFALVDLVAEGRSDEARAFIAWARQTGFNVLRVLTMLPNGGWMNLSPEDGRRALPRVLELARAEGMYVQAVALANTDEASGRFRDHAFEVHVHPKQPNARAVAGTRDPGLGLE